MKPNTENSKLAKGEHFAEVNGIKIHYFANGNGPLCFFPSPGWGISVDYIMPQAALEKHFTVIYFDTRLSGKSSGPSDASKYSDQDFLNDIDALRCYFGQEKIWLSGHSAGGYQVLNYAINYPDHVSGLLIISGIAAHDEVYLQAYTNMIEKRKTRPFYKSNPGLYNEAAGILLGIDQTPRNLQNSVSKFITFYFHDPSKTILPEGTTLSDEVYLYTSSTGFYRGNLLPKLSAITVPVLVIVGDDDFICDEISQARRIHQGLPMSTLIVIANCGHIPWAEQPGYFEQACDDWLTKTLNR